MCLPVPSICLDSSWAVSVAEGNPEQLSLSPPSTWPKCFLSHYSQTDLLILDPARCNVLPHTRLSYCRIPPSIRLPRAAPDPACPILRTTTASPTRSHPQLLPRHASASLGSPTSRPIHRLLQAACHSTITAPWTMKISIFHPTAPKSIQTRTTVHLTVPPALKVAHLR